MGSRIWFSAKEVNWRAKCLCKLFFCVSHIFYYVIENFVFKRIYLFETDSVSNLWFFCEKALVGISKNLIGVFALLLNTYHLFGFICIYSYLKDFSKGCIGWIRLRLQSSEELKKKKKNYKRTSYLSYDP